MVFEIFMNATEMNHVGVHFTVSEQHLHCICFTHFEAIIFFHMMLELLVNKSIFISLLHDGQAIAWTTIHLIIWGPFY